MNIGQAFEDLQNLDASDLKKIGTAPLAARIFILALALAAIVGAGIWFLAVSYTHLTLPTIYSV